MLLFIISYKEQIRLKIVNFYIIRSTVDKDISLCDYIIF